MAALSWSRKFGFGSAEAADLETDSDFVAIEFSWLWFPTAFLSSGLAENGFAERAIDGGADRPCVIKSAEDLGNAARVDLCQAGNVSNLQLPCQHH